MKFDSIVVVARCVPAAAKVAARRGFGGVGRKADAGAGRVFHGGGSAGTGGGCCCCARRCWMAPRSMRAMARSSVASVQWLLILLQRLMISSRPGWRSSTMQRRIATSPCPCSR